MQGRNWIIIGFAVILGLFAVYIANTYFSGIQEQQVRTVEEEGTTRIAVASQPLEFGTRLTAQNIRLHAWPADSVPEGAFRSIPDALKDNRVALRPIVPGEPVLASKVSGTDGRATLAALLPEGLRAVSVPVGAVTGVSGFVLPGTMVDVILTRQIAGDGADQEDVRSDVILQNVQVLAVDQTASDKAGGPKVAKTATVAVALRDAQRLAVASKIGSLSLALRKVETAADSATDEGFGGTSTITNRNLAGGRISIAKRPQNSAPQSGAPAAVQGPPMPRGPTMMVVRGTEQSSYSVGRLGGW